MNNRFETPYSDPRWWWTGDFCPVCFECARFQGMIEGKVRCKAFPKGIPKGLFKKGSTHDAPIEGDHGLYFIPYRPAER